MSHYAALKTGETRKAPKREEYHDSLAFKAAWMGRAVRPNETVDAELGIMHWVPEIASIAPVLDLSPINIGLSHQPLIHPVPNEATLQSNTHHVRSPVQIPGFTEPDL